MIKKPLLLKEINFILNLTKMFQPLIVYSIEGELYCKVNKDNVKNFLFFLKYYTNTYFKQLIDLFGIDNSENYQRFEVSYNLLSVLWNNRLNVLVNVLERQIIDTVSDLYKNAAWYEREVYDMYGVFFQGNKDLRRILTDYGFIGYPLRKDFPLTGFVEVRFDDFVKRLRNERVSLTQEYRIFSF